MIEFVLVHSSLSFFLSFYRGRGRGRGRRKEKWIFVFEKHHHEDACLGIAFDVWFCLINSTAAATGFCFLMSLFINSVTEQTTLIT